MKIELIEILKWVMLGFTCLIVGLAIVNAQSINPGACYTQNFYSPINSTLNTTINICALNCSNTFRTVNISLKPGETKHKSNTTYDFFASCSTNQTSGNKCILNDDANPGERYKYTSTLCEIDIDIDECTTDEECREGNPVSFKKEYHIQYNNQSERIQFNFGEKEYIWSITDNLDAKDSLSYTCPSIILNNSNMAATTETCHALGEVYCGDAFDLMVKLKQGAEERRAEYEAKLENCRLEVQTLKTVPDNSICMTNEEYTKIKSENLIISNETMRCSEEKGRQSYELGAEKENGIAWMILAFFLIALNTYQYFNPRAGPRASKVGGVKF